VFPGMDPTEVVDPAIRCDQCSACCCRKEVWVLGDARVPGHLAVCNEHGVEIMERLDDGWCIALDRQRMCCGIYADRPQVCRDVRMGGSECRAAREEFGEAAPGC
jgi:Fe-S-cluster containining protein